MGKNLEHDELDLVREVLNEEVLKFRCSEECFLSKTRFQTIMSWDNLVAGTFVYFCFQKGLILIHWLKNEKQRPKRSRLTCQNFE